MSELRLESSKRSKVAQKKGKPFKPPSEFSKVAAISTQMDPKIRKAARANPQKYWADAARELTWFTPFKKILIWNLPFAKWFSDGKINASYNCLDRHLEKRSQKIAIIWEAESGELVRWTYKMLHRQVEAFTAVLRQLGLKPGDRVAIYLSMVPEAVVAMLACARGGFVHLVVFSGFSSEALKERIQDSKARLLVTIDGGNRKGIWTGMVDQVNLVISQCPSLKSMIVLRRSNSGQVDFGSMSSLKIIKKTNCGSVDVYDYHSLMAGIDSQERKNLGFPEKLPSEHPLFILYTSGTTGKPKGILHTTGGYLTCALRTVKTVFDLKESDLFWCTADIGWVTGHTYFVYGPLAAGASILMFEGVLTYPKPDRAWSIIARNQVTIFYTAPTAIRASMRLGDEHPKGHDLTSLRLLGSVGEPINPEAWLWYHEIIGGSRCPIVDTYWQTETGSIVIAPLPGSVSTKPGSATLPLPGYDVEVVDRQGRPVTPGVDGYLVIRQPWPSMARTIYQDPRRFKAHYWEEFPGLYFTGDGARKDDQGYIWCQGRVDDVLNVSGHRLGTMEIESALASHADVAEAAVVGCPDDIKGQAIVAFVSLKAEISNRIKGQPELLQKLREELKRHVVLEIGAIARPQEIQITDVLPKTRSGKIMRRLLRELATTGRVTGNITTLEDLSVIHELQNTRQDHLQGHLQGAPGQQEKK